MRLVSLFLICLAVLGLGSCENSIFDGRPQKGLITFDVTYPYIESGGIMAAMMPKTMEMKFQDDVYTTDLKAGMGLFRLGFIADNKNRKLKNILKVGGEKLAVELAEQEAQQYLQDFPELTIIFTDGLDTIAGFPCKQAIAIYNDASKPDMTIYYTDAIKLTQPNWCTQFHEIDGVLLAYEIDRYDIRMRFRASGFEEQELEPSEFEVPDDFSLVSAEVLESKVQETLGTFQF